LLTSRNAIRTIAVVLNGVDAAFPAITFEEPPLDRLHSLIGGAQLV